MNSGRYTLQLHDGTVYEFNWPDVKITALLSREPKFHYTGSVIIRDARNRLASRITFCDSASASELRACWGEKPGANDVRVEIVKTVEDDEFPLVEGRGNWARYLQFEEKLYWRVSDRAEPFSEESVERALPSAALHRKELKLIAQKKYGEADKLMEALEGAEHKDAQLRRRKK